MFAESIALSGFKGLGDTVGGSVQQRPTIDYVKAGDVIRVNVSWTYGGLLSAGTNAQFATLRAGLQPSFNVLAINPSAGFIGGTIIVEVQPRSDYNRLNDVVSIVAHEAENAGFGVDLAETRGEFISKVETTGGNVPSTIPDPRKSPSDISNTVNKAIDNLTSSPTSLALIVGGTLFVVFLLKK